MPYNRRYFNESIYNAEADTFGALPATVANTGATRSPFGHTLVAIPDRTLIFIYQDGTAGLVYRISTDGGQTWGAARVIDSDTATYASAVVNPTTKDVHIVYSNHGDPPSAGDESVFYRPLLFDSVISDWVLGGEQRLAGGGGLYDPETAGRRNASISANATGRLVVTYLRNESGVVTWAALVSQTAWSTADMDVEANMRLAADEDTRGAAQQTIVSSDRLFIVARTGSTYTLSSAVLPNPIGVAAGVDVAPTSTWLGDTGEMVAVAYAVELDRLGIIYLRNNKPHFRLYSLGASPALISDTEIATSTAQSVSLTWDGSRFWLAWVTNDNVKVSHSDAPTAVVQTFSNTGPNEDWSWLNSAVSELETSRIVFVWSQTNGGGANNIYVGSFAASRALSGSEAGVGADSMKVGIPVAETGAGADTMSASEQIIFSQGRVFNTFAYNQLLAAVYNGAVSGDLGIGQDSVFVNIKITDSGVGVDAVGKKLVEAETGVGVDSMRLGLSTAETGAGVDSATVQQTNGVTDTGAGVDTPSVRIIISDAGGGDPEAKIRLPNNEVGAGADSMMLNFVQAETGAGADNMQVYFTLNDSGVGVDDLKSLDKRGNQETGVGVDSLVVRVSVAETGAGADAISTSVPLTITVTDTGTGVDAVSQVWIPTATVVRLLFSGGTMRLKVES